MVRQLIFLFLLNCLVVAAVFVIFFFHFVFPFRFLVSGFVDFNLLMLSFVVSLFLFGCFFVFVAVVCYSFFGYSSI